MDLINSLIVKNLHTGQSHNFKFSRELYALKDKA